MKKFAINMDQTPVFFTSHSKQTLEMNVKKVAIHTFTQDTRWATVAKIIMSIPNPSEDDEHSLRRSFTLKYKHELVTKIESCCSFSASSDEAFQQFGINSQCCC